MLATPFALAVGCHHPDYGEPDGGRPADLSVSDGGGPNYLDGAISDGPPTADAFVFPTPIHHVVVIVKENHTFDNFFGAFPGAEGITTCPLPGGPGPCPVAPDKPRDLCHEHECGITDWNHGAMDGWAQVNGSTMSGDNLAWSQYNEAGIPNYWAYAKAFTLADHFFADEIGPSFPGHMFTIAAQSGWAFNNPDTQPLEPIWGCSESADARVPIFDSGSCTVKMVFPCFNIPSIPTILPSGINWKFYGTNYVVFKDTWSMFNAISPIRNGPGWANVVDQSQFAMDVKNGTLPEVVWVVPQDVNDEHPGFPNGGVCAGENASVNIINDIMSTVGTAHDYWKDVAIFITYDDFGGWYDHVPPPRQYGCDANNPYGLGFRLPLIIVSPYARPGFVFKEQAEHASIPRFIEKVVNVPPLSTIDPAAQDGQANDLMGAFDFTQKPNAPLALTTRFCPP
jgi:phospholipase C